MTPKPEKTEAQKVRSEAYKKLGILFGALLLVVNTVQLARFGAMVERVDKYNQGLIDELGGIRQDVVTFAGDLNEMRSFLLLPTKEYSFSDEPVAPVETEEKEMSSTETAIYTFLTRLTDEEQAQKNTQAAQQSIETLKNDESIAKQLAAQQLQLGPIASDETNLSLKISEGDVSLFTFLIEKKTKKAFYMSALENKSSTAVDEATLAVELVNYVTANKEKVKTTIAALQKQKEALATLPAQPDIAKVLTEKKLQFSATPEEDQVGLHYHILNANSDKLLTVSIRRSDAQLFFNQKTYKDLAELTAPLLLALQKVDARSAQEKLLEQRRQELEAVFKEEAFKDLLKNSSLTIALEPREEYNKLLYDVKNSENQTVLSFAIEISSGMFKIIQNDKELDLYSTLDQGSKKKP